MFSRLAGVGDVEAGAVARLVRRARRTRPLRERKVRRLCHRRGNDRDVGTATVGEKSLFATLFSFPSITDYHCIKFF